MSVQAIAILLAQLSIFLTVFAVALDARLEQTLFLFRHPAQLVRSLAAMSLVMPLFVVVLVALFPMAPVVKITLAALSVSPVPPILPNKLFKLGASESYVMSLFGTAALLAVVLAPLTVEIFGLVFAVETSTDVGKIAVTVLISVLLPLAAGLAVRRYTPHIADAIVRPCSLVGAGLLAVIVIALVITLWPLMVSFVGTGTIWAFVLFAVAGMAAGHLIGGPSPEDRTVLAFATASRHPGVAAAIAAANFHDARLVGAAVVLYILVSLIVSMPYTFWRKRQMPGFHAPA
jgi:BASS family bile acid:Na+ symporter